MYSVSFQHVTIARNFMLGGYNAKLFLAADSSVFFINECLCWLIPHLVTSSILLLLTPDHLLHRWGCHYLSMNNLMLYLYSKLMLSQPATRHSRTILTTCIVPATSRTRHEIYIPYKIYSRYYTILYNVEWTIEAAAHCESLINCYVTHTPDLQLTTKQTVGRLTTKSLLLMEHNYYLNKIKY